MDSMRPTADAKGVSMVAAAACAREAVKLV